jgi:hypothetical protein
LHSDENIENDGHFVIEYDYCPEIGYSNQLGLQQK